MTAGQPTKYRPEYCEMLKEHMSKGYSFESFGAIVKSHKDTLYNWTKLFPEFSDAKKEAFELNRLFWEDQGLKGLWEETEYDEKGKPLKTKKLNSTVWIFNMKNRFGWVDRVEHSGDEKKPVMLKYNLKELDDESESEPKEKK